MSRRRKLGDCYLAAVKTAELVGGEVVHGTVESENTPRHGHAWVELNGHVIDRSNGHDVCLPQQVYYRLGRAQDVRRYSPQEARTLMSLQGHYGPWHPVVDDGAELVAQVNERRKEVECRAANAGT